jgi:hypothetical protein
MPQVPDLFADDIERARTGDESAIVRLIAWTHRVGANPTAYRAAVQEAEARGCDTNVILAHALLVGVLLAVHDDDHPRRIRLRQKYIMDSHGNVANQRPSALPPSLWRRWWAQEVSRLASAWLTDEPLDRPAGEPIVGTAGTLAGDLAASHAVLLADPEALDPLEALVASEQEEVDRHQLLNILGQATPRERDLLVALYGQLEAGHELDLTAAAHRLGIAPATARVQMHHIRLRVR